MTRAEQHLRDILRDVTPEPPADVRYGTVVARGRRRRQAQMAVVAAIAVVLAGSAGLLLNGPLNRSAPPIVSPSPHPTPSPSVTAQPTPAPPPGTVAYRGVWVTVPTGWHVALPRPCTHGADKTVTFYYGRLPSYYCPAFVGGAPTDHTLAIASLHGSGAYSFFGGDGKRTTWHGQPAFESTLSVPLGAAGPADVQVELDLPWLDVRVAATAPTEAQARKLLDAVVPHPVPGLGVAPAADAVEVSWRPIVNPAPTEGTDFTQHVTRPQDVAALLADLRALAPVTDAADACGPPPEPDGWDGAELTVRAGETFRSFDVEFGDCNQVTGGSGQAARTSAALRADIVRLATPAAVVPTGSCVGNQTPTTTPGSTGAPTIKGALDAFLANPPSGGYALDDTGWWEVDLGEFRSKYGQISIVEIPPPGSGWEVQYAQPC